MSFIGAKIYRRTRKGDWMGRTVDGREVLFSGRDERLYMGVDLQIDGLREGDHVNFPIKYGLPGELKQKIPIARGVITRDQAVINQTVTRDPNYAYWETVTDQVTPVIALKKNGNTADLGSVVDIYDKQSDFWKFVPVSKDWSLAEIQYPNEPLTEEQQENARRLSEQFWDSRTATVVLNGMTYGDKTFFVAVFDKIERDRTYGMPLRTDVYHSDTPLEVGTRIILGRGKKQYQLFYPI